MPSDQPKRIQYVIPENIPENKNLDIILDPIKRTNQWSDEFYRDSNNSDNFEYDNVNDIIFN